MGIVPNAEFLDRYLSASPNDRKGMAGSVVLPTEKLLIEQAVRKLEERRSRRLGGYTSATVVDYPELSAEKVSLGTRVGIVTNAGRPSLLDVVGCTHVYESDGEESVRSASLEAPLVQAILGSQLGDVLPVELHNTIAAIEIVSIDQAAIQQAHQALGIG